MPQNGVVRSLGFLLALCIVGLTSDAFAQSTFGTVLGTVTDASGGLIANASIVITNTDENTTRSVDSDERGDYQAVNMKPGHYRVDIVAPGFEPFASGELVLAARQTLRVDASLTVGKLSETVSVSGAGAITTDTQTISSAIGAERILNLPANYRATGSTSPYILIGTLPGVQSDNGNSFMIQGALPSQTQYSVDGISITNVGGNSPIQDVFPSSESLAEIKVQGVGNSAEYGMVGDITTVSKSGTNQLHGTGFWFHNDDGLDAKAYGALTKPERTGNNYGASVGGPLVIPGLYNGHSKSFFFATFEGFKFPREKTVQNTVPTAAMRAGDFSAEGVTIIDPQTGQPFPGNRIPDSRISPIAKQFLTLYPQPNNGDTSAQHSANYVANYNNDLTSNQYDLRLDHYVTTSQSVYGRFSQKKVTTNDPQGLTLPSSATDDTYRSFVASHNYTITSSLLNEARIGFSYHDNTRSNAFNGRDFTNALGLVGIGPTFPFNGLSALNFSGDTSNLGFDRQDSSESQKTIQFADSLTWSTGRHTMKFGVDLRRVRAISPLGFNGADNYGNFDFSGAFTGSDFADFLLGLPEATSYSIISQDNNGFSTHYAAFAQDSFQAGKNLTLEYGVRWEYHPAYEDASGNIGNFDPSVPRTGQVVYPTGKEALLSPGYLASFNACPGVGTINGAGCTPVLSAADAGLPESLRKVDPRVLPRFGFAYRPFGDDQTVVRGGIGGYSGATLGSVFYSLTGTLQSDVRDFTNLDAQGRPIFAWPNIKTSGSGISTGEYGTAYFGTANDIDWKDPYSVQWNLSIDRYLGGNIGLRLSYIGMHTTQLVWAPDLNQMTYSTTFAINRPLSDRPFPNWGTINTRSIGASAKYNAMQVELNRRYSKGFAFTTTYTLAKNLTDTGGPTPTSIPGETAGGRAADLYNRQAEYGNDYATRRHRSITTVAYELPFGAGKPFLSGASPLVNGFVGGWQLSAILLMQSGPHLTPYYNGIDPSGTGSGVIGRPQHPDRVGDGALDNPTREQWFDTSAFACPGSTQRLPCAIGISPATDLAPIGRFGNAGVGILTGPGTFNLSLGLQKSIPLTNGVRVEAGIAFTNVLNHPNLADPNMNAGSDDFGVITSARTSDLSGSRTGQVNLRIRF